MVQRSTCRSCGAEIQWCRTASDKAIPIDAAPHPDGNVFVGPDGVVDVLGKAGIESHLRAGLTLYRSHFASCPNAAEHRRPR